ncbi:hypothetical protein BS50DRAFT_640959 [Corynespora cassiicola Philippines]|uniref:ABM domain-containing protein n=1 Tax=Corynespora cassiicola Philippines TaxID=1448308 RepID=A0A2T2N1S6_CORCC|nr:hypothetical protein BS50DRAFT_640959 [Corynespora cassiicola Philippines]
MLDYYHILSYAEPQSTEDNESSLYTHSAKISSILEIHAKFAAFGDSYAVLSLHTKTVRSFADILRLVIAKYPEFATPLGPIIELSQIYQTLDAFHKIVEYSTANEPDVIRYVVALPIDDATGTVLYMIEEYASPAANDAHIATPPVQELIALFTSGNVLASPPEVNTSPIVANKASQPPPTISANPAIVLAHFEYKPGTLSHAVEGWKQVVDYVSGNEEETRGYTVLEDKETNCVRTVEVYDSWDFVEKVHLKSAAIGKNQEQNGKDRTGVKGAVHVRAVDGFLGRAERARI